MNNSAPPSVDVVVVNWNGNGLLKECLSGLAYSDTTDISIGSVVIVDNASTDDSMSAVEGFDLPLCIVLNDDNVGFGAAANSGARLGASDYILFLNPDVELSLTTLKSSIGWFEKLAESHKVAVCGIRLFDANGDVAASTARVPSPLQFWQQTLGLHVLFSKRSLGFHAHPPSSNSEVDHVVGAYYLIKRSVFEALGGFDERFFMYFEDLDLSVRLKKQGWAIWYLADVCGYHEGGGASRKIPGQRLAYAMESRIRYGFKHFGRAAGVTLAFAMLLFEFPMRIIMALVFPRQRGNVRDVLEGWYLLVRRFFKPS